MTLQHDGDARPQTGWKVYTADGAELGTIKEIRGHFFKLDAPLHRDFWLRLDCIRETAPERTTLGVDKERLDECRAEPPEAAAGRPAAESPYQGTTVDPARSVGRRTS